MGRRGRLRALSEEERKLWQNAMRDASPIRRRRRKAETAEDPETEAVPAAPASPLPAPAPARLAAHAAPALPARALPAPKPVAPPLTGIDRRTSQKLGRGQVEFEAKLDLHGHSREDAYVALRRFLSEGRRMGFRCVLVVTGKGENPFARHTLHTTRHYDTPERQGILRAALPQWLQEPELRSLVSGFQPAHPKHGGGGAFYVLLRRKPR